MTRKNKTNKYVEIFDLKINQYNNKKIAIISVEHDFTFWKPLKEQAPETFDELRIAISKDLKNGLKSSLYQYNNFECSIKWHLKEYIEWSKANLKGLIEERG